MTDFLASQPTDEEVLDYKIPPDLQTQVDALLEIKRKKRLTAAQREELGDFRFVDDVMTRLKAKIKLGLDQANSDNSGEASAENDGEAPAAGAEKKEGNGS